MSRPPLTSGRGTVSPNRASESAVEAVERPLGGLRRRRAPAAGLRPTVRFGIAAALTSAFTVFGVWATGPWREQLEDAIGPVMAWVIPTFLAYIPGVVIGLMVWTLIFCHYRERPAGPPGGDWPEGRWPAVTVVIAAWNEEDEKGDKGRSEVVQGVHELDGVGRNK